MYIKYLIIQQRRNVIFLKHGFSMIIFEVELEQSVIFSSINNFRTFEINAVRLILSFIISDLESSSTPCSMSRFLYSLIAAFCLYVLCRILTYGSFELDYIKIVFYYI